MILMDSEPLNQQLSRISTLWTLIHQAHGGSADAVIAAQRLLMERYCGAVYRYLLGALRDQDAALESFQEFALRFVRGDFRRANPERGRFRDFVKTALIHLVADYQRAQRARPGPLPADLSEPPVPSSEPECTEADFITSWREELINRAWQALAEAQPVFHAVLLLHVQNPELPSPQMAQQLAARLGKPFTAGNVRVTLHRARERFADLLLDEVAHSLEMPAETELVQELTDLRLLSLCRPALVRRGHSS